MRVKCKYDCKAIDRSLIQNIPSSANLYQVNQSTHLFFIASLRENDTILECLWYFLNMLCIYLYNIDIYIVYIHEKLYI